jgi:pimeloyl-ACP methyl ester carboxylesterase
MRRTARLLIPALVALALVPVPGPAASGADGVSWHACQHSRRHFDCAKVQVPLDYDDPSGRQITLRLVRHRATGPGQKLGSIFLNPGGPGGSGIDMVRGAGSFLFSDEVRARFDLVGFDPRGIMRSSPLLCYDSFRKSLEAFAPFAFPVTPQEEATVASLDAGLNRSCEQDGGAIADHMATADVARDLDLLREAVGDERLNYVGYSYGSFLGVTYANMFPDRVGSLVVDGVLDPIAWTTGVGTQASTLPFSTRLRSDQGAMATLEEFFRLCDEAGPDGCAISGDAAGRFAALADQLRVEPIQIDFGDGDPVPFTYADLIGSALGNLYGSLGWPFYADFLGFVESQASPSTLGRALLKAERLTGLVSHGAAAADYPNFVEGFPGVACSDSVNPDTHAFWSIAGAHADEEFGYFGRPWTWATSICAVWEGFDEDRYLGPFDQTTARPVLVVGTLFDPATRYEGALAVHGLLHNSALLTVEGWGHTSLFLSACADAAVSEYLLTGTTPPEDTTCAQDISPFDQPMGDARARLLARARVMSQIALRPAW